MLVTSLKKAQKDAQEMPLEALGHGSCPDSCTTACRCQCRSEPTPADGVGSATTIAQLHHGRLSISKSEEGGLRSHRLEDMNTAIMAGGRVEAARVSVRVGVWERRPT